METTTTEILKDRRSMTMMVAGTMAEGISGVGAIVLSIIGLIGVLPEIMLPVATVAAGAALLFEGGAVTARYSGMLKTAGSRVNIGELGLGITTEFFGGTVGIIIGLLALMGINSLVLVPSASIIFGSVLIFGSVVTARLNSTWMASVEQREIVREVSQDAISAAAGVQLLIGLGAITLGILALAGMSPMTLSLVAMLSIGFSDLLSGTTIIGRLKNIMRRYPERV